MEKSLIVKDCVKKLCFKKVVIILLLLAMLLNNITLLKADATAVETKYGSIEITNITIDDEELTVKTNVNPKYKKQKYLVEISFYEYRNNELIYTCGGFYEDKMFYGGKKISVSFEELNENIRRSFENNRIYAIQAVLHDADNYDFGVACFAWSDYHFKKFKITDNYIKIADVSCKNDGHLYDKWKTTKKATVFKKGQKTKECFLCGKTSKSSIDKLKPTIKLSSTKKTIKQLHSFNITVKNIANGDSISSVKTSSSKIISVKKSGNKITVKGKKVGNATITVKLKSGKSSKCKVKVIKDKLTYSLEDLSYSTRNNVMTVWLKNTSKHTIKVYASNAKLVDWDYKKFDRTVKNVNGKSSVTIKPGKTVKLKFYLKGESTWPGYQRKTMKFKVKFDGAYKWIKVSENNL